MERRFRSSSSVGISASVSTAAIQSVRIVYPATSCLGALALAQGVGIMGRRFTARASIELLNRLKLLVSTVPPERS